MADAAKDASAPERPATPGGRWRHVPWVLVVLADAGLLLWGAMAALAFAVMAIAVYVALAWRAPFRAARAARSE